MFHALQDVLNFIKLAYGLDEACLNERSDESLRVNAQVVWSVMYDRP